MSGHDWCEARITAVIGPQTRATNADEAQATNPGWRVSRRSLGRASRSCNSGQATDHDKSTISTVTARFR
jgi:hypothetical protein